MGDYINAKVTAGGRIRSMKALDAILDVMADEWGGEFAGADPLIELVTAAREGRAAVIHCGETGGGLAESVVSVLSEHNLSWRRDTDANGEYNADVTYYDAKSGEETTSEATDGAPMVSLTELRTAALKGQSLADVIADLAKADRDPPALVIAPKVLSRLEADMNATVAMAARRERERRETWDNYHRDRAGHAG